MVDTSSFLCCMWAFVQWLTLCTDKGFPFDHPVCPEICPLFYSSYSQTILKGFLGFCSPRNSCHFFGDHLCCTKPSVSLPECHWLGTQTSQWGSLFYCLLRHLAHRCLGCRHVWWINTSGFFLSIGYMTAPSLPFAIHGYIHTRLTVLEEPFKSSHATHLSTWYSNTVGSLFLSQTGNLLVF